MFPYSRELQTVPCSPLLRFCLNPNSCSLCYITSHTVLAERLLKSRNISPLEPNVKCQTCETQRLPRLFTPSGTHHSMSGHFPRQIGLESYKKRRKEKSPVKFFHLVLFSFSASVFFHLGMYLSPFLFSFSLPPPPPPPPPPEYV